MPYFHRIIASIFLIAAFASHADDLTTQEKRFILQHELIGAELAHKNDLARDVVGFVESHEGVLAIKADGTVQTLTQKLISLDKPDFAGAPVALDVLKVSEFQTVVHSADATIALLKNGQLYAWGNPHVVEETRLLDLHAVSKLVGNYAGAFAVIYGPQREVISWGTFGRPRKIETASFVALEALSNALGALRSDGRVVVWGNEDKWTPLFAQRAKAITESDEFYSDLYGELHAFFAVSREREMPKVTQVAKSVLAVATINENEAVWAEPSPSYPAIHQQTDLVDRFRYNTTMFLRTTMVRATAEGLAALSNKGEAVAIQWRASKADAGGATRHKLIEFQLGGIKAIASDTREFYFLRNDGTVAGFETPDPFTEH